MIRTRVSGDKDGVHLALASQEQARAELAPGTTDADRLRASVERHYAFVARSLRLLGVRDGDVDDAAQQVFIVLSKRLGDVELPREKAFLHQTAIRIASRARRTRGRRREVAMEGEGDHDGGTTPDALVEQRRARETLDEMLSEMPLELRAVFVLFEVDELSMTEAAELLGIPRGTVASRLRRAREQFVRQLAKRGLAAPKGGTW